MMKRLLLVAVGLSITASVIANNTTGHTFFSIQRPYWQSGSPERVTFFRQDIMDTCPEGWGGGFQAAVFGGKSTNANCLGRFFYPVDKTALRVKEYKAGDPALSPDNDPTKDVEARNFNIATVNGASDDADLAPFESVIQFNPDHTFFGIGFAWKQQFWRCDEGYSRFWYEIAFPVVRISNNMNLSETIISDGGGSDGVAGLNDAVHVASMRAAFAQPEMLYGRIPLCGPCTKWGVGDVEIKFGWNSLCGETCHYNSYVGIVAPTGNRPEARVLFEPIVGNNHHWGIMYGSNMGYEFWTCRDHSIEIEFDLNGRYLFTNHQRRLLSLHDKSWGTFLEMYRNVEEASAAAAADSQFSGTFGANILAQCVKVSPRFSFDLNSALIYRHCGWEVEAGYNFYARHKENVCLESWTETPQVKNIDGQGDTNTARTIKNNFTGSSILLADYQPIFKQDLDLGAAAHPAVLANIIYVAVGYQPSCFNHPMTFGLGGGYEFSSGNDELSRWTLWGKYVLAY